jgi:hypothetical protein
MSQPWLRTIRGEQYGRQHCDEKNLRDREQSDGALK